MLSNLPGPWVLVALGSGLFAGCASVPADRGFQSVRQLSADRGQLVPDHADADRARLISEILAQPLTDADAVRVAFLSSPRIQSEYARLGFTGADVIQAGRLSNPTLSAAALGSSQSGAVTRYDLGLTQNFANLLLLRSRARFSRGEFERMQLDAAQALLDLAAQVQLAYYDVVGAQQIALMRKTIAEDASAAAELSSRFKDAGNRTALQLALDRATESEARLELVKTDADAARAVSHLNELMGLNADAHWTLKGALPLPVAQEETLDQLQQLAASKRLDLQSARRAVDLLQDSLGITRRYRYVGDVEVGAQYERDTDRNRLLGPTLGLQLPFFSQGQAPLLRAQARLELAQAQLQGKELEVSNAVKRSLEAVVAARHRIERLRGETIPLREAVVTRTQEQVNYMLVGAFDLLRAKQDEYSAYQQYLEAVRDYWLARVELSRAIGTRLPSDASIGEAIVVPEVPVEPPEGSGRAHHGGHESPSSDPSHAIAPTPHQHHPGTAPSGEPKPEQPSDGDKP
ncbi:MAG: TolC family protein [Candidatus Dormibacteraceae bacterium]